MTVDFEGLTYSHSPEWIFFGIDSSGIWVDEDLPNPTHTIYLNGDKANVLSDYSPPSDGIVVSSMSDIKGVGHFSYPDDYMNSGFEKAFYNISGNTWDVFRFNQSSSYEWAECTGSLEISPNLNLPGTFIADPSLSQLTLQYQDNNADTKEITVSQDIWVVPMTVTGGSESPAVSITSDAPTDPIVAGAEAQYAVGTDIEGTVITAGCDYGSVSVSGSTVVYAFDNPGDYEITVTASKDGYVSATQTFTVHVVAKLVFLSSPAEGDLFWAVD